MEAAVTLQVQYLESAKVQEVASQLAREGYEVQVSPERLDNGYDIVASLGKRKVAVQVKANAQLKASAEAIKQLRKRAFQDGFDEFRLVVVSPPHERKVAIEGLDQKLLTYMYSYPPTELIGINATVRRIAHVDVDSIELAPDGTRVAGSGAVDVDIEPEPFLSAGFPPGPSEPNWWSTDFPFAFDVALDRNLEIAEVNRLEVDTSSFD
jgi:hypothetical protein